MWSPSRHCTWICCLRFILLFPTPMNVRQWLQEEQHGMRYYHDYHMDVWPAHKLCASAIDDLERASFRCISIIFRTHIRQTTLIPIIANPLAGCHVGIVAENYWPRPRRFNASSMSLSVLERPWPWFWPSPGFNMSRTFSPPRVEPPGVEVGGGVWLGFTGGYGELWGDEEWRPS